MLKIITWIALALLMLFACVRDVINGDILFAIIAGFTCIMDIGLVISEIQERKILKKFEDEWEFK